MMRQDRDTLTPGPLSRSAGEGCPPQVDGVRAGFEVK